MTEDNTVVLPESEVLWSGFINESFQKVPCRLVRKWVKINYSKKTKEYYKQPRTSFETAPTTDAMGERVWKSANHRELPEEFFREMFPLADTVTSWVDDYGEVRSPV